MGATGSSEMFIMIYQLHSIISKKTATFIFTTVSQISQGYIIYGVTTKINFVLNKLPSIAGKLLQVTAM